MNTRVLFGLCLAAGLSALVVIAALRPEERAALPAPIATPPTRGAAIVTEDVEMPRDLTDTRPIPSSVSIMRPAASAVAAAEDDVEAVYLALFSADPRVRIGALDRLAAQPARYAAHNPFAARLEEMAADFDSEVAERAVTAMGEMVAWRVIDEARSMPATNAWEGVSGLAAAVPMDAGTPAPAYAGTDAVRDFGGALPAPASMMADTDIGTGDRAVD